MSCRIDSKKVVAYNVMRMQNKEGKIMKDMLEEYGWAIAATIIVLGLLGLLFSLSSPSNPLGDAVRKLLMATTY